MRVIAAKVDEGLRADYPRLSPRNTESRGSPREFSPVRIRSERQRVS